MLDYNVIPKKEINNRTGIYILSPYNSPDTALNKKVLVKIGKAYNLHSRLDGFHTCFPDSFWTYSIIRVSKANYGEFEKTIHTALAPYLYKHPDYEARIKGEWFKVPKRVLRDTIRKLIYEVNYRAIPFNIHPEAFAL